MAKRILQLGAGELMVHSIKKIRQLGYEVFTVDKNSNAPAFALSDGHANIDIADTENLRKYANEIKADAVLAVNDPGLYAATFINRTLGLKGNNPDDVILCTDKGYMREKWNNHGLAQPRFIVVNSWTDIEGAIKKIGLPVILKPCYNWGSRGISLVEHQTEIAWAIDFARQYCKNERYIIEEFVHGTEMTVEGIAQNGEVSILAKSDKVAQAHKKFRVAMQLNYPATFETAKLKTADDLIINAARALGIVNGAIHAECMVNDKGVYLIEMAGRPGGGNIFGQIVEASSGICFPQALVNVLLNIPAEVKPKYQHGACYKFFKPPIGKFVSIENLGEAKHAKGILDMGFNLATGTLVSDIASDVDRPGYIVSEGKTREDAIHNAENALSILKFNMA